MPNKNKKKVIVFELFPSFSPFHAKSFPQALKRSRCQKGKYIFYIIKELYILPMNLSFVKVKLKKNILRNM